MKDFFTIKIKLINIFLLQMPWNVLDISYSINEKILEIQIVLLEGTELKEYFNQALNNTFETPVKINTLFISKSTFNQGASNWLPVGYTWLTNVLYSKAEIL